MSSEAPDPQVRAIETALSRLAPSSGAINRDELLFRAGQASVGRRRWIWPAASAASLLTAVTLGLVLLLRPEPQPVKEIVIVRIQEPTPVPETPREPAPSPEPPSGPLAVHMENRGTGQADYLRLRNQVIHWGVDALPSPSPTTGVGPPLDRAFDLPSRPGLFPRSGLRQPGDSL